MSPVTVRSASAKDGSQLAVIYNHYIENTLVTFEEASVDAIEMVARLSDVHSAQLPWLVAEREGRVVGYAYASKWRGRCAYRYSAETTVYLDTKSQRRGIGSQLYRELLSALGALGYHVAIGGIALPNEGSVALHERLGFEKVAHFKEVGFKFGGWIDVGYWQRAM